MSTLINNNENNNNKSVNSGSVNEDLCGFINAYISKAMQGIPYWRKHRHHKCYKCKVYGHIAPDCDKVCKLCGNIHSSKLCYHSLITLLKKTVWIVKNNCIKDPEKIIKQIKKTEQAVLKSELEKSLKLRYENLEVCHIDDQDFKIKREYKRASVTYDPKYLKEQITDQWSILKVRVRKPTVLLQKLKTGLMNKMMKTKKYGPISQYGQVQLRTTQREYKPIEKDRIKVHLEWKENITTPLGVKRVKVHKEDRVLRVNKHVIKPKVGRFVATQPHEIEFLGTNVLKNQEIKDTITKCESTIKKLQKEKSHLDQLKQAISDEKKLSKTIAKKEEHVNKLNNKIDKLIKKKDDFVTNFQDLKARKLQKINSMQQRLYRRINKLKKKKEEFYDKKDKFYKKQKETKKQIRDRIEANVDTHYKKEMAKKLKEIEQTVRQTYPNTYKLNKKFKTLGDYKEDLEWNEK